MEIQLTGRLCNTEEAVRDVRHIYPEAPKAGLREGEIAPEMVRFMADLLREGSSRALFLWLLKVTLDITAPASWWSQGAMYFNEIRWVRKHPRDGEERAPLRQEDFEGGIPALLLESLNDHIVSGERELLETALPENFIRRGYALADYASLRRLHQERSHYNSGHWRDLTGFLRTLPYAELIINGGDLP